MPYEETPDGEKIYESELISLLNNPNNFQGRQEFMTEWYYYLLAAGTNYIYPLNPSVGFSNRIENTKLINLNFDKVIEPCESPSIFTFDGSLQMEYLECFNNGGSTSRAFNYNEVISFFDSTSAGEGGLYKGKSRLETITDEIKNIFLATKAKQNKLDISGITIVSPNKKAGESDMSEGLDKMITTLGSKQNITQKQHIELQFKNAGLSKGRAIIVSSEDLKTMNLSEALEKLRFDPMRIEDARTIKRKFMIPENLLPLTDRSEKEKNNENEVLSLIQTMVEPYADNFGKSLSQWFGLENTLKFDYSDTPAYINVKKDRDKSDQEYGTFINELVKSEVLTVVEARQKLEERGLI